MVYFGVRKYSVNDGGGFDEAAIMSRSYVKDYAVRGDATRCRRRRLRVI